MAKLDVIKVFIASPGDLAEERELFPLILGQLNEIKAEGIAVQLKPLGWEDTLPGWGRPQELINDDVRQCDIFVMMLWKRWGTPSGEFDSGTEEEFTIAYETFKKAGSPYLLLYFRSVPQAMMADPGEQLKKVLKFRAMIEEQRIGLFRTYDQTPQWRDLLMKHLSQWIDRRVYGSRYATETDDLTTETGLEVDKRLIALQTELEKTTAQLKTTQSKLRAEAVRYAVEATLLSEEGSLTLAEQKFAKSIELYEEPEVLQKFALFLQQTGSLDRARSFFERVLGVTETGTQEPLRANACAGLGSIFATTGDSKRAETMFLEALKIDSKIGRNISIATTCINLGNVYMSIREMGKAEEMYTKALQINESLGRMKGLATSYVNIGNVNMRKRDLSTAREMYSKALQINRAIGRKKGLASSYVGLGSVYASEGLLDDAEDAYREAIDLYQETKSKGGLATAYLNLGSIDMAKGELSNAEEMYKSALEVYTALGRKRGMASAYRKLSMVYKRKEDPAQATIVWGKAVELSKDLKDDEQAIAIRYLTTQKTEPIVIERDIGELLEDVEEEATREP